MFKYSGLIFNEKKIYIYIYFTIWWVAVRPSYIENSWFLKLNWNRGNKHLKQLIYYNDTDFGFEYVFKFPSRSVWCVFTCNSSATEICKPTFRYNLMHLHKRISICLLKSNRILRNFCSFNQDDRELMRRHLPSLHFLHFKRSLPTHKYTAVCNSMK
jgi:hypothetical protein